MKNLHLGINVIFWPHQVCNVMFVCPECDDIICALFSTVTFMNVSALLLNIFSPGPIRFAIT